jgi:hypothetical protein
MRRDTPKQQALREQQEWWVWRERRERQEQPWRPQLADLHSKHLAAAAGALLSDAKLAIGQHTASRHPTRSCDEDMKE